MEKFVNSQKNINELGQNQELNIGNVEGVEAKLGEVEQMYQQVGGEEGTKNTLKSMPKERLEVLENRIRERTGNLKTGAFLFGVMLFAAACEYLGIASLSHDMLQNFGKDIPDHMKIEGLAIISATLAMGVGGAIYSVKNGIQSIGERFKFAKLNKQEVVA